MFKFAIILLLVCLLFRWALGSWPWQMLRSGSASSESGGRGLTPAQRLEAARALLGVGVAASDEEIRAAHKRLVSRVHPDRGGTAAEFQAANDARDLLLLRGGEGRIGADREG